MVQSRVMGREEGEDSRAQTMFSVPTCHSDGQQMIFDVIATRLSSGERQGAQVDDCQNEKEKLADGECGITECSCPLLPWI